MNTIQTDVLVIGAGPSGLAASIELRRSGVENVLVVDREKQAGGIPRHCHHIGFGIRDMYRFMTGPSYAARYVRLATDQGVKLLTETTVTDWHSTVEVETTSPNGRQRICAQAILLATGCRERPRSARMIPGSRCAGIYTTGSLQNFAYIHHHPVGKRALVIGAEHVSYSAVLTLKESGVDVVAMVTDLPRHQSYLAYRLLSSIRHRIPLLSNTRVSQIFGQKRVEGVELSDVRDGSTTLIECDTVVFSGGWIPDYELAHHGGLEIDSASRSPQVDLTLQTSEAGIFAAGNLIHAAETADVAALSGRFAARSIKTYLFHGKRTNRDVIPIKIRNPICWISPHMIGHEQFHAPYGHFIIRVMQFLKRPVLEVWQGDRQLWHQRYRKMVPNLPVHVSDRWLCEVDPVGPNVRLELSG